METKPSLKISDKSIAMEPRKWKRVLVFFNILLTVTQTPQIKTTTKEKYCVCYIHVISRQIT